MKDKTLIGLDCLIMIQHSVILLMLGPMVPEIMRTFSIGEGTAGLLLSAGAFGSMIGPLIAGFSIDRSGLRTSLIIGFFTEVVFLILFGLTPVFWLAVVFNLFLVLAAGSIETSVNVIPTLVNTENPGPLMNLVHLFFSIGALVTPLLVGFFIAAGGRWQTIILVFSIPTALLGIIFIFTKFTHGTAVLKPPGLLSETPPGKTPVADLLKNRTLLLGILTLFLYVGGELGFSAWIVHYLEKKLGFLKMQASIGMSLFWIGIMIGRLTNSLLARKFSSLKLITYSSALSIVCGIPFLFASALPLIYVLLFLIGLGMAGGYPNTMAEINRRFPGRTGTVSGMLTFGAGAGAMVFLWLIGFTAEQAGLTGSMVIPFVLMALMTVTFTLAVRKERT